MRVGLHERARARQLPEDELERDRIGALPRRRDAQLRRTRYEKQRERHCESEAMTRHA
jgi:hypothetical protein